jgi:DNA-directed RNA polymerase subunit RPC12/RpoP
MPIDFTCKCGKHLRAKDDQASKRIQCPACGRALVVPELPANQPASSEWQVDTSDEIADRAQAAGVVAKGRANVALLHGSGPLLHELAVTGEIACWHCRSKVSFTGRVFGRVGLAGPMLDMACPKCHAKSWMGYSSHASGAGTDVYLYAPSRTREGLTAEEALPAPDFRIEKVTESPEAGKPERGVLNTLLPRLVQAVSHQEAYQEVSALAARLVGLILTPSQQESVCRSLQTLLEKETKTYLLAILVEALACLRDESAAKVVQAALRQTLAKEDPSDPTNLPLHDLCMLSLLFGDGNGFLEAMNKGLKKLTIATRVCKMGKQLTPEEVLQLILKDDHFDSFESTLGGSNWQYVYPLLPLWVDEEELRKENPRKENWLHRFFYQRVGGKK